MNKVVGIKFEKHGKIHEFDPGHFVLRKGIKILIEGEYGLELGVVCTEPKRYPENLPGHKLKRISRLATKKDIERAEKKCRVEDKVYSFCRSRIEEISLPMNIASVKRFYDGSKIIIYFTADGRVDFRALVKNLIQKFHTRIEMRQIGVRQQAKSVSALGTCGRQSCCSSFLTDFAPVSIKMAKEQNVSLNSDKISGMCGRLMCCLAYEHKYYQKLKKEAPKIGGKVNTTHGSGKVIRQNLLKKSVVVMLDSGEEVKISLNEIKHKDNAKKE